MLWVIILLIYTGCPNKLLTPLTARFCNIQNIITHVTSIGVVSKLQSEVYLIEINPPLLWKVMIIRKLTMPWQSAWSGPMSFYF